MSTVNIVGITKPSEYTACYTANELVAWAARVSNPSNQNNTKTAPKLIQYLINHDHWSPFEIVHVSMEIRTTRDIARQILRHRSFSFQEFSQRYADPTVDLTFCYREARLQDNTNRQNSIQVDDPRLQEDWNVKQREVINTAKSAYKWAADNGIAKEQRRVILPEGNTESVVIMAGTLRSWIHYCILRRGNGTQKEHTDIANKCWKLIGDHFPDVKIAVEAIERNKNIKDQLLNTCIDIINDDQVDDDNKYRDLYDRVSDIVRRTL